MFSRKAAQADHTRPADSVTIFRRLNRGKA